MSLNYLELGGLLMNRLGITARIRHTNGGTAYVLELPDTCPSCGMAGQMLLIQASTAIIDNDRLQVVCQCPGNACGKYLIGNYNYKEDEDVYILKNIQPTRPVMKVFPGEITDLSS